MKSEKSKLIYDIQTQLGVRGHAIIQKIKESDLSDEKLKKLRKKIFSHSKEKAIIVRLYKGEYHIEARNIKTYMRCSAYFGMRMSKRDFHTDNFKKQKFLFALKQIKETVDDHNRDGANIRFDDSVIKAKPNFLRNSMPWEMLKTSFPDEYAARCEELSEYVFENSITGKSISLLPHQIEDVAVATMKDSAMLLWETGLGKTVGALAWAKMKGGTTLILAPAVNLYDPWVDHVSEYIGPPIIAGGTKKLKDKTIRTGGIEEFLRGELKNDFVIISHSMLNEQMVKRLKKMKIDNVIIDESHNLKNRTTTMTKRIFSLSRSIPNRLILTGTPIVNKVEELYIQLELLNHNAHNFYQVSKKHKISKFIKDSSGNILSQRYMNVENLNYNQTYRYIGGRKAFMSEYAVGKTTVYNVHKHKRTMDNQDGFKNFLDVHVLTRVFDEEKPRINEILNISAYDENVEVHKVDVEMTKDEKAVNKYVIEEFHNNVIEKFKDVYAIEEIAMFYVSTQILSLQKATSCPWVFDEKIKYTSKMASAMSLIKKHPGEKIIIGTKFIETLDRYDEYISSFGIKTFKVNGQMPKKKKAEVIRNFRTSEGQAVLIGTMSSMKTGLNIPEASVVIAESYPWTSMEFRQFCARAIRLNSESKTEVYCLAAKESFDQNMAVYMTQKSQYDSIVKGKESSTATVMKEYGVHKEIFKETYKFIKGSGELFGKVIL